MTVYKNRFNNLISVSGPGLYCCCVSVRRSACWEKLPQPSDSVRVRCEMFDSGESSVASCRARLTVQPGEEGGGESQAILCYSPAVFHLPTEISPQYNKQNNPPEEHEDIETLIGNLSRISFEAPYNFGCSKISMSVTSYKVIGERIVYGNELKVYNLRKMS